jgi:hypothetical protein
MGAIVFSLGVISLGAVVGAVVVVVVLRSRRNSGTNPVSPSAFPYAQNMSYPSQQPDHPIPYPGCSAVPPTPTTAFSPQPPTGYRQYPDTPPNQGYPALSGQSPQHPNPYAQQPPYQGQ